MDQLKEYFIQFSGLKLGKHQFDYHIDNTFFEHFNFDEYTNASVAVKVVLEKKTTMLELVFSQKGFVNVPCDLTNENFDLPIKSKLKLLVKFGETFNDENEDFLILPHGEYQVNVAQYIYEMIVLSVPSKRIHPGIKDGTLKSEALNQLEKLSPSEQKEPQNEEIDPRWAALKKLLTDNK
jgi:uncharacterized metal-binding protein YceD (DUF177 family)